MKSEHTIYYLSALVFVGNTFENFAICIIYLCLEDFSWLSASLSFHSVAYLPTCVDILFDFFLRWCALFFTWLIFARAAASLIAWALRLQLIGASKLLLLQKGRLARSVKTFVAYELLVTQIAIVQIARLIDRRELHAVVLRVTAWSVAIVQLSGEVKFNVVDRSSWSFVFQFDFSLFFVLLFIWHFWKFINYKKRFKNI